MLQALSAAVAKTLLEEDEALGKVRPMQWMLYHTSLYLHVYTCIYMSFFLLSHLSLKHISPLQSHVYNKIFMYMYIIIYI